MEKKRKICLFPPTISDKLLQQGHETKKQNHNKIEGQTRRVIRWRQVRRAVTAEDQGGRTKQGEAKEEEKRERGAMFEATTRVSAINI